MVLITFLMACLKNPTIISSATTEQWPAWMILELETDQTIPSTVSTRLLEVAKQHNIQLDLQSTPAEFEVSKHTASLTSPALFIETQAEFYAQVNGRFRWEVRAQIDLYDGAEHHVENLVIPVFHQFHHQRHAESLEAALPTLERKLHAMLNQYIQAQ